MPFIILSLRVLACRTHPPRKLALRKLELLVAKASYSLGAVITALSHAVCVFTLLLMFGCSQVFTLDIGPSHSAIILSFTSPTTLLWWLLEFLNTPAYPCSTQDTEGVLGGHCGIVRSAQETPGCFCGTKGKNPSRRQNTQQSSHSCGGAALLSGRSPWSSKPSRVQRHRSWCSEFNKEYYPFANSLILYLCLVSGLY